MSHRRISSTCEDDNCWICLDGDNSDAGKLIKPCACPRLVHSRCLSRWQLQNVSKNEEHSCRFCKQTLPDWSDDLLPAEVRSISPTAVMAVVYGNTTYKVPVRPGPDGEAEFKATVKTLFGFRHDAEFDVTFEVKLPSVPGYSLPATGDNSNLVLRGLNQFGAAATCAQASAVARALQTQGPVSSPVAHSPSEPGPASDTSTPSDQLPCTTLQAPNAMHHAASSRDSRSGVATAAHGATLPIPSGPALLPQSRSRPSLSTTAA